MIFSETIIAPFGDQHKPQENTPKPSKTIRKLPDTLKNDQQYQKLKHNDHKSLEKTSEANRTKYKTTSDIIRNHKNSTTNSIPWRQHKNSNTNSIRWGQPNHSNTN